MENFELASCAEKRTGEATYARGRKCENALELRGKGASAEFPGQAIARESTLAQGDGVMGALGCTQRTRGSRRVGSALEWQGGRRVSAQVQPARNFQGVSFAPGSAQHEQSVQDVSFAS